MHPQSGAVAFVPLMFNLAEVTRMIEIARALESTSGLRAHFLGYETQYVRLITEAGFPYRAAGPAWTPAQQAQALAFDQGRSLRHPFSTDVVRQRVRAERAFVQETGAVAMVHGTNITSNISARAERIPLFYAVPFAMMPPHVSQTRRLEIISGSGRLAAAADRRASAITAWATNRVPLAPRAFARVAAENQVPPIRRVPGLLEADHNLLTVLSDEVEGYALPPSYRRVGPIFAHLPGELPDQVLDLAARSRPLVYLGLGSSANRATALRLARALGRMPVNVVAPIGHYLRDDDDVPGNVTVTDLLPAHLLGGVADAAVLHGGQGSVQTACATGIPFVGLGFQAEQRWNVRVCEGRGNAVGISLRDIGSDAFAAAVRRVIGDPEIRQAALSVRRLYDEEDGAAEAAAAIAQTLAEAG